MHQEERGECGVLQPPSSVGEDSLLSTENQSWGEADTAMLVDTSHLLLPTEPISDGERELEKWAGCRSETRGQAVILLPSVVRMLPPSYTLDCDRRWLTEAILSTPLTVPT